MATIVAPLAHFELVGSLRITDDLLIEPIPKHMLALVQQAQNVRLIRHPAKYTHCIVAKNSDAEQQASRWKMESLITLLRLFKPGDVYYNYAVVDESGWYENRSSREPTPLKMFAIYFFFGWDHRGLESTYVVENADRDPLSSFLSQHQMNPLLQHRAYRYFFRAYHEPYSEDRFLDNSIALENLLVNDTKDRSNLRYKFIDRGCFLLQQAVPSAYGAAAFAKHLRDIYDVRCEIVHSRKDERNWDDPDSVEILQKSDDYLRTLLRYVLDHPELADSAEVDMEKRKHY